MLVMTIGLAVLAIAVACSLFKFRTLKEPGLSEPRAELVMTGVQIICGDCSGDAESPRKTYLDRRGLCEQCGGRSFMLASNQYLLMISHLSDPGTNARLQPIEAPTNLYGVRVRGLTA